MRGLQCRSSHASIARDELTIKIVAQQILNQTDDNWVGENCLIVKRRTQLRENPPARAAFPKYRLRLFADLIPAVPLLAVDAVAKNVSECLAQLIDLRWWQKMAEHNAASRLQQEFGPTALLRAEPRRDTLSLSYVYLKFAHQPVRRGEPQNPDLRL